MASHRHKHAQPRRSGLKRSLPQRSAVTTSGSTNPAPRSHAAPRHTGPSALRRNATKVVLPSLGVLALVGVSVGVVAHEAEVAPVAAASSAKAAVSEDIITEALQETGGADELEVSRSAERPELPDETAASIEVTGTLLALSDGVEIHADADGDSPVLASLDTGDGVDVTGEESGDWVQVVHKDLPRWVKADEVAAELPLSNAPCPVLGNESGLQPDTIKTLRAVCAEFPQISTIGGIAGRGEHATGHSLDIMLGTDIGYDVADFLQKNQAELGIEYLIYRQRIWRPATSGQWRGMSDRGSATANHMDHVHVSTYGSSATS